MHPRYHELPPRLIAGGQLDGPLHIAPTGRTHALGVRFRPAGARAFLGVPLHELTGRTHAFEFLRIVEDEDGQVAYHAQPGGGAATVFVATSLTAEEVLFENPEHDFPTRIRYRRTGETTMVASIEGAMGGEEVAYEMPFERPEAEERDEEP